MTDGRTLPPPSFEKNVITRAYTSFNPHRLHTNRQPARAAAAPHTHVHTYTLTVVLFVTTSEKYAEKIQGLFRGFVAHSTAIATNQDLV